MENKIREVTLGIIGAGPGGIATAVEAKANGISSVLVLEKGPMPCYTLVKLFKPGKRIDANYKGIIEQPKGVCSFQTETKEEFLERINRWIKEWNIEIIFNAEVTDIKKDNDGYIIFVNNNPYVKARFVVIAIGIFGRPNKPSYPIPKEIRNRVFFEPPNFCPANTKVLVVGGGNTAAETACYLTECAEVYLSYRRPKFFRINETNLKILEEKVKQGKIKLLMNTDIEKLEPTLDKRVRVVFKDGKIMEFDYIFYCLGGRSPIGFLKHIGIEFTKDGKPLLDEYLETNLPGVFLVGDIAVSQGNISLAFVTAYKVIHRIKEKYLKA